MRLNTTGSPASRLRIAAALVSALLSGAACSNSTGPGATIAGTYILTKINGATLPATFADKGIIVKVSSGSITLNLSGRFSRVTTFSGTGPAQSPARSVTCEGIFLRILNTGVVFKPEASSECEASPLDGSWDIGHTMTLEERLVEYVYKK